MDEGGSMSTAVEYFVIWVVMMLWFFMMCDFIGRL